MGNSCIVIRSVGPHGNNSSGDAERIAIRCVEEMKSYGHTILSASVETGGRSIEIAGPWPAALDPVTDPDGPGRAAYERYLHAAGGRSLKTGALLPHYDEQSDDLKAAWRAAADPSAPRMR